MQRYFKEKYIIAGFILTGLVAFLFWFFYNPVSSLTVSLPGLDKRPDSNEIATETVKIGESFEQFAAEESSLTGKWTRLRGADFDNINKENIKLIDKWTSDGPKILWKHDLGEGHAAPVIYNGKVYILDYIEEKKMDALRCFSLESGKELWRRSYKVHVKRNHGMSRTVPAINDKYLVTVGPRGHVMCVSPQNGNFLWGIDMVKEYKSVIPFWYTGQCPLIDNDTAILAPGGKSLLIAVDCATGKIAWETPNPDNFQMSHSSVMPMKFEGKKMYVYAAVGGICGISAEGPDKGKLLWKTNEFAPSVIAPSPLILENGKILITAGYGAGSAVLQLKKEGSGFSVKVVEKYKPSDGIASEQQTPLLLNGCVLAILPKDAGASRNQLVCSKQSDCRKILWTSGKNERFGLGPYIIADGKLFILSDDGTVTIAKASTQKYLPLDSYRVIKGQDAWGPLAIADGRLIMRDSKQMVCIDIRAK
ncbi:MAG: PQQ-binding-like beta-propeller repeat protein [Bacteroidales bacterium]